MVFVVLRRLHMKTALQVLCCQLGFLLLIKDIRLLAALCTDNQYTLVSHNGSRSCVDCFECPKGLGPSVECGSIINPDTKRECKDCRTGITFSSSNDFEQCQTCSTCSDDQVSKSCTTSRDTVCEKKCASKENYYEKSSDDCQPCSSCCGDENDIVIDECMKKGMPAHKRCTVHRKRECAPPSASSQPTSGPQTTKMLKTANLLTSTDLKKTIKYNNMLREFTSRETANNSIYLRHQNSGDSSDIYLTVTEFQVFVGVSSGIGFLVVCCLIGLMISQSKWRLKNILRRSERDQALTITYSTVKSQEDSILVTKESTTKLFDLFNKDPYIKEKICHKLDRKKYFAKLARHYKMDEDKVRKLEERCPGDAPSEEVFDFLEGEVPNLRVGEFATFMEEIGKVDVVQFISSKLSSSNEIHNPLDQ